MWGAHEGMGWWMIIGSAWFFLLLAIVVAVAIRLAAGPPPVHREPGALDIARERYARGEITREQFEEIKRDLHLP